MAKKVNKVEGSFSPEEGKSMAQSMTDLLQKTGSVAKAMAVMEQAGKNYTSSLTKAGTATDKLIEKLQASSGAGVDLGYKLSNIKEANKDIEKSFLVQNYALQKNLKIEEAESILARQDLVKQAIKNKLSADEKEQILAQYDGLQKNLKIQEHQQKLAERLKKIDAERSELMESINEKAAIAKLILTDQRALAAAGIATMIKGYHSLSETFDEFRKEGLSVGQAMKETGVGVGAMFSLSGASLKENAELMAGMSESMGNMNSITTDTVAEVGKLAKTLGVSALEAGKLQGQLMNMPGATAESATNTMEFAGALAMAAHVAPGAVMKDMAANAEDIALNTKNGGKDMAVVSVAAHKLGVEMSTLTKMSAGLLDFENSINKQMEASVLLGKEINLDKAREAALNGDILGATQEMLKNVGGEAEFNKMNVIQRKALADSMGVSVSDLSKMVKNQDQLANLTEEQNQALADGVPLGEVLAANAAGFAGKLKDGALSVAGLGATVSEISGGFKDAKNAASGLFGGIKNGLAGMKDGGGVKGGIKGMLGMDKTPIVPPPVVPPVDALAGSGKKMSGGGMMAGFKKNMKALAGGFKEMGAPGVLMGVFNTAVAGPALVVAVAALPFLALFGTFPYPSLKKNFTSLAAGLVAMAPTMIGSVALGVFGTATVPALASLPFLALFGTFPYPSLKKNFTSLATGLLAMSSTFVGSAALGVFGTAAVPAIASLPFLALFGTFPYPNLKKNFTSLATGLLAMAPTMIGSVALGAFALAGALAFLAIPFMIAVGAGGAAAGEGLVGLALGLKGVGIGAANVVVGNTNLMGFALAGAVGLLAIPFMIFVAAFGWLAGMGLKGLSFGLKALADPTVAAGVVVLSLLVLSVGAGMMMFGIGVGIAAAGMSLLMKAIGDIPIENLLIMPIAFTGIAIGLGLLAVAAMLAAPGLILASFGLAIMVLPLAALSMIASTGAINMLGDGLKLMGEAGPGLGLVAMSMMGIGAGLGLMAYSGLLALPVIGALIALATVAPALIGLGAALGGIFGGEGGEKEDKMDTLIAKIDKLISVASKGGVVNMDGKKVGDIIYQSINTTNIR